MTRLLLLIKHKIPFLWKMIDWLNELLFVWIHGSKLHANANKALREFVLKGFEFRLLSLDDLGQLEHLLHKQGAERLRHFRPHEFDSASLERVLSNRSFLMFGVFQDRQIVGYFFLRCFWNWRCFVGRLIDEPYERKGIGRIMNSILYNTAWYSGFRCYTTISRDNAMVMRSHANNPAVRILKELPNDYLLIEFRPVANDDGRGDSLH